MPIIDKRSVIIQNIDFLLISLEALSIYGDDILGPTQYNWSCMEIHRLRNCSKIRLHTHSREIALINIYVIINYIYYALNNLDIKCDLFLGYKASCPKIQVFKLE